MSDHALIRKCSQSKPSQNLRQATSLLKLIAASAEKQARPMLDFEDARF
jgi:hypothetical protein